MNKKQLFSRYGILLLTLVVFVPVSAWSMPGFSLEDQYERSHSQGSLSGKVVVIIAGDLRDATDHIRTWANAIKKELGSGLTIRGFCNLDGVPFFIPNSAIRNTMKKKAPNVVIYCDWKGKSYSAFGFPKKTMSASLYDKKGNRVKLVVGKYSAEGLAQLKEAMKKIK